MDIPGCRIHVRHGYRGRPTKGKRARMIFIGPTFALRLKLYRAEAIKAGASILHPDVPVWPGRDGSEMGERSPTQAAARAMVRAGLTDGDEQPIATLHDLRRTCGSLMLSRGVPLIVVSRHLGHADVQITARVYAHLLRADQLAAAPAAFEALYAANGSSLTKLDEKLDGQDAALA